MAKIKDSLIPLIDTIELNWRTLNFIDGNSIKKLINKYGIDILYQSDDHGLYPIHWAAINGKSEIVNQLIKAGISPTMKAKIFDGPEPIHFAALEGNIEVLELLLANGANIDVEDNSGCTPLIRAAMFGSNPQTKSSETVLYLISRGSDPYKTDFQGLNCLHYAVLQNNEETVQLLLNLGFNPNTKDSKGLKPFDYAMKTGNTNIMKLLAPLTDGLSEADLQITLEKFKKKTCQEAIDDMLILMARIFVILEFLCALFWAYPQYFLYYLPQSSTLIPIHISLLISSIVLWISWYKTCSFNPGYLPINTNEYQQIIEDKVELGIHQKYDTSRIDPYCDIRLCHTCKTIQTNRSKHCRFCKRCTARFDHHCIYLATCVGHNNRLSFFSLTLSMFFTGILGFLLIFIIARKDYSVYTHYNWLNACYCLKLVVIGGILTLCTLRRAAINLTQNEEIKSWRYRYLKSKDGKFCNPFDKGSYWQNIVDFFKYRPYYYTYAQRFDY